MDGRANWKYNLLVTGIAVAVVGVSLGVFIYFRIFSAVIMIYATPFDAKVMLDGREVKRGEHRVVPGEHEVSVVREGFAGQTQTIEAVAGETKNGYFALASNDPATANWYAEHPNDQQLLEGMSSWEYDEAADAYRESYPILQYLPYKSMNYEVGYGRCQDGSPFCIVISASVGYKAEALRYIARLEDLGRYKIEFANYYNPYEDG